MKMRTTIKAQTASFCLGFMNNEDNQKKKNARTMLNHFISVRSSESKAVGIFLRAHKTSQ